MLKYDVCLVRKEGRFGKEINLVSMGKRDLL